MNQTTIATPKYLSTKSDLTEFNKWLNEGHGVRALDTETTGLDTRAADFNVRQIAFGAADGSAFVVNGTDSDFARTVIRLAIHSGLRWWAHNATYDAAAIKSAYGLKLRGLQCSLVLTRTLQPAIIGTSNGSLKTLRPATQFALDRLAIHWSAKSGVPVTAEREHSWLPACVAALPPADAVLLEYAATDAVECARLVAGWSERVGKETRHLALLETRIEDLWRWPAAHGYRLDTEMLQSEMSKLEAARATSLQRWGVDLTTASNATREWVRSRGILIVDGGGKETLSHKCYDKAYIPPEAAEDWESFRRIREVSQTANKLNELARLVDDDNRIYPSIHGIGAHTGRMSIGKPALQNLPAPLRGLLMADESYVLVGCDLDRVEPRVIAALSDDVALTEAVQQDVYTELAVGVWGEEARGDDSRRKIAKTAFLAMAYGQGVTSLSRNLGITVTEANEVLSGLRDAYPTMTRWMNGVKKAARDGLPLQTAYGRPLPPTPDKPYRAVNWVIQGTAADLFKRITVKVAETLGRDALWLPVHDELIVQAKAGEEQAALEALRDAMTTEINGVPITGTPVVIGTSWGKA